MVSCILWQKIRRQNMLSDQYMGPRSVYAAYRVKVVSGTDILMYRLQTSDIDSFANMKHHLVSGLHSHYMFD